MISEFRPYHLDNPEGKAFLHDVKKLTQALLPEWKIEFWFYFGDKEKIMDTLESETEGNVASALRLLNAIPAEYENEKALKKELIAYYTPWAQLS